jgi:hypothetical protein
MTASLISHQGLDQLVATHGYLAVAVGVGLESVGLDSLDTILSPRTNAFHAAHEVCEQHRGSECNNHHSVAAIMF